LLENRGDRKNREKMVKIAKKIVKIAKKIAEIVKIVKNSLLKNETPLSF